MLHLRRSHALEHCERPQPPRRDPTVALLRPMALAGALLLGASAPRPAQAGANDAIHLAWNDCRAGAAASADLVFDCFSNTELFQLVCGLTLSATLDSVIAVEVVVDVQHQDPALPAWWQVGTSGCRALALEASAGLQSTSECAGAWGPSGLALLQGFDVGQPRGGANQVRIRAVAAVVSDSARTWSAATPYAVLTLSLDSRFSSGTGACTGCIPGACLVLNSMLVKRLPGGTGDVFLSNPWMGDGNRVTWQGGGSADCEAVPIRRATWGQVKSLYR